MRIQRIAAVARFELLSVVKRWSYLIATFGLPLFLAVVSGTVLGVQTYFLTQRAAESSQFGLVDEAGVIDHSVFEERDGSEIWTANGSDVVLYENRRTATKDLESGRLRALYVVEKGYLTSGEVRAIQSEKTPLLSMRGTTVEPLLRSLLRRSLVEGRLEADVQERVLSPAYFIRSRLGPDGDKVTDIDEALDLLVRTTIPLFLGILLLTALLSASGYLVQTVSTDKESKIVEVLLSSVTPEEILAGKLFGLGAAGLIQFAVWSSMVVFVALSASAALATVVSIPWQAGDRRARLQRRREPEADDGLGDACDPPTDGTRDFARGAERRPRPGDDLDPIHLAANRDHPPRGGRVRHRMVGGAGIDGGVAAVDVGFDSDRSAIVPRRILAHRLETLTRRAVAASAITLALAPRRAGALRRPRSFADAALAAREPPGHRADLIERDVHLVDS
jgi:hypothetical protein